jgi:hypothetical protein
MHTYTHTHTHTHTQHTHTHNTQTTHTHTHTHTNTTNTTHSARLQSTDDATSACIPAGSTYNVIGYSQEVHAPP